MLILLLMFTCLNTDRLSKAKIKSTVLRKEPSFRDPTLVSPRNEI